jgi:3-dehydroquinate synthase class II
MKWCCHGMGLGQRKISTITGVCVHVHVCVCARVCVRLHICVCTCSCMHTCMVHVSRGLYLLHTFTPNLKVCAARNFAVKVPVTENVVVHDDSHH